MEQLAPISGLVKHGHFGNLWQMDHQCLSCKRSSVNKIKINPNCKSNMKVHSHKNSASYWNIFPRPEKRIDVLKSLTEAQFWFDMRLQPKW